MKNGWSEVSLDSITQLIKRGVSPKYVESDGYPIINQKCIRDGFVSLQHARMTSKVKKITSEKFVRSGDVLINSTGTGTLGRTAVVKNINQDTTVDTHVTIVRANELVDKYFLGYLIRYHEPLITSLGKGATNQIELSRRDLEVTKVKIPTSKVTQRKIADILSAYDDLTENNKKRMELLEEQAKLIYEEWFVRIKFPNYENALIDKETGLPEGWEDTKIGEVFKTSSGGTPSKTKEVEYYENGDIPWVRTGELKQFILIESERYITEVGLKESSAKMFPKNTVLLAMYGNTIGETTFAAKSVSTNQACCAFLVEDDKAYLSYFIHQYLLYNKEYILNFRMGAAQENISQSIIKNIEIIMPSNDVLLKFEQLIKPLYLLIENLAKQNKLLEEARDILLPRLMMGIIEV